MIKSGTLFWLALVSLLGFATFKVKYGVQDLEDQLVRVQKQTVADQQEIRVLNAEWTYLTQPERLEDLNRRFLALGPIAADQLVHTIAELPFRASPQVPADGGVDPAITLAASRQPAPAAVLQPTGSGLPDPPPASAKPVDAAPEIAAAATTIAAAPPRSLDELFAQIAEQR